MCKFASFILTKDREFWSASDKHEDIIAEHNLCALDGVEPGLVRIEILPSETPRDLSTWNYEVDQDVLPEWTFDDDPELERRARAALERRATDERWFAEVIAHQATAGYAGTATAGDDGTATAGDDGTATAGARGTATAGDDGTATAGDAGTLNIRWWDGKRYRIATFYVGESGIEPNTPYGVDKSGKPVRRER